MTKATPKLWLLSTVTLAVLVGLAMVPLSRGQQTDQSGNMNGQTVTATGCLERSTNGSGYQLTDQSTNTTYQLSANSSDIDLSAQVGHTVTVTGTSSSASGASSSPSTNPSGTSSGTNSGTSGSGSGTGSESGTSGSGSANSGSSSSASHQLTVTNVKMVSSSCQQ